MPPSHCAHSGQIKAVAMENYKVGLKCLRSFNTENAIHTITHTQMHWLCIARHTLYIAYAGYKMTHILAIDPIATAGKSFKRIAVALSHEHVMDAEHEIVSVACFKQQRAES